GFLFMTEFSLGDFFAKLWKRMQAFYQFCKNKFSSLKEDRNKKEDEIPIESINDIEKIPNIEPEIEEFTEIAYSFDQTIDKQSTIDTGDEQTNLSEEDDDPIIHTDKMQEAENLDYELPSSDLLEEPAHNSQQYEKSLIQKTVRTLEKTFH